MNPNENQEKHLGDYQVLYTDPRIPTGRSVSVEKCEETGHTETEEEESDNEIEVD
jgi:hypothetical protein